MVCLGRLGSIRPTPLPWYGWVFSWRSLSYSHSAVSNGRTQWIKPPTPPVALRVTSAPTMNYWTEYTKSILTGARNLYGFARTPAMGAAWYPRRTLRVELDIVWNAWRLWVTGGGDTYEFWQALNGCLPREGDSFDRLGWYRSILSLLKDLEAPAEVIKSAEALVASEE